MKYLIFKTQFTRNGKKENKKYTLIGSSSRLVDARKIFNQTKNDLNGLKPYQVQITELWKDTTLIDVDERRRGKKGSLQIR